MASTAQKSIGEQLRAARESKGWTLAEAAKRTKVKVEQLEKLEKNQFDLLPSLAYARGFIRIYARELGLDGWALLRQFHGEIDSGYDTIDLQPQDLETIPKRHQPAPPTSQNVGLFIIVLVLVVALVIGAIEVKRHLDGRAGQGQTAVPEKAQTDLVEAAPVVPKAQPVETPRAVPVARAVPAETPAATPPAPAPAAVPVAPAVPVAVPVEPAVPARPTRTLQLQADPAAAENERWVRVVGLTGGQESTLFEGFLPPGQAIPETSDLWRAEQFIVTLREASAVDIIFNGTNYGRYDRPGVQRVTLPAQP